MTQPLLSICIPTYNRAALLERNIGFHLREFRRLGLAFELVVVDDGSTDGTAAYLAGLAREPELRTYRRLKNSGFMSNYAYAMRRARGRYALFLGDDDMLVPEQVADYLRILQADPQLGMLQAPWMLVDERSGGADIKPFYALDDALRIARGDHPALLRFILDKHVFPEFMIVRRDVLQQSISSATPFIFWAFLYTARALDKGDVLFMPAPFARVTAASDDPRAQQGNTECMFQWDSYLGGLEYIASLAGRAEQGGAFPVADRDAVAGSIRQFMRIRQAVALRLLILGKHWAAAYVLYHRMAAHGPLDARATAGLTLAMIAGLAGAAQAASEASEYSAEPVIVDPAVSDDLLEMLPLQATRGLTRDLPAASASAPRAWLRMDPAFGEPLGPADAAFDIPAYVAQFI
ncbi:MAG: glycosyltransferase family 2 protein [Bordetella sp.]|uniref:glycosyltransferase family 2 protein n=1 Tax=Bordetella sp. TaxID=28081 RepID=UPI003F7C52A1